jgi:hypothetical protein
VIADCGFSITVHCFLFAAAFIPARGVDYRLSPSQIRNPQMLGFTVIF